MADELYPWQQECLALWEQNEYRGIVQAVTGAGKTRLALAGLRLLAHTAAGLRVKVVVPKKSLLPQWKNALKEVLPTVENGLLQPRIGICGGGRTAPCEEDYMLYVINSARSFWSWKRAIFGKTGCFLLLNAGQMQTGLPVPGSGITGSVWSRWQIFNYRLSPS